MGAAGDGRLLYAGSDGPISSIRLAALRDGLEDAQYLAMAEAKLGRAHVRGVIAEIASSLTKHTGSASRFTRVRRELGMLLSAPGPAHHDDRLDVQLKSDDSDSSPSPAVDDSLKNTGDDGASPSSPDERRDHIDAGLWNGTGGRRPPCNTSRAATSNQCWNGPEVEARPGGANGSWFFPNVTSFNCSYTVPNVPQRYGSYPGDTHSIFLWCGLQPGGGFGVILPQIM